MKIRVISAIIMLAIFVPFLMVGGVAFVGVILLTGLLAVKELIDARENKKKLPLLPKVLTYLVTGILILNNYTSTDLNVVLDYRIFSLLIFSLFFPIVLNNNQKEYNIKDAFYLMGTSVFLGLAFNLAIVFRNHSLLYLVYLVLITIVTDTFAYISGSLVGKNLLAKDISPKKTVEGLIGGTLMGTFVAMIYYIELVNPAVDLLTLGIVTISLSLIGQIGDLVFSAMKRYFNYKDFSNLIPGHGGILDRFDSLIFVLLATILFLGII